MTRLLPLAFLGFVVSATAAAADDASRLADAAQVLRDVDTEIPSALWNRTHCAAVIPNLDVRGTADGRGVMSCRIADRWSAPVFLQLVKGSWAPSASSAAIDLVLLVMNDAGVQRLLDSDIALGRDVSAAAGPAGDAATAAADATVSSQIIAYARSARGFDGVDLHGAVLRADVDANHQTYGADATARTILASREISAPTSASPFLDALNAETALTQDAAPAPSGAGGARSGKAVEGATSTVGGDAEIRARIVEMEATIDRLLGNASPAVVGTAGATDAQESTTPGRVVVDRALLMQLRQQLEALMAALPK